jgi:hypothetical protein
LSLAAGLALAGPSIRPQFGLAQEANPEGRFWSFRKPSMPPIPSIHRAHTVRTPVDAFVLARLESSGLFFSPEAAPITLIRRAYLDLIGLPPSPQEVDAFLSDHGPGGFERLVDLLLASPRFGERWGRHWLDVAGYVDTVGFDVDADLIITSDGKWRYRDYVIQSFNEDKPYDQSLIEQLAGDELVDWRSAAKYTPEIRKMLIATGFLRTAPDFTHEDVGNIPLNHFGILHDTIEIIGSSLLSLTLNCARCHNHKFDPISQEDYYRLMAVFTPAYNPANWKVVFPYDNKVQDRSLPDVSAAEKASIDRQNADIERQAGVLERKIEALQGEGRNKVIEKRLAELPGAIRSDVRLALATPAEKRNEIQKYLAGKFEELGKVIPEQATEGLSDAGKKTAAGLKNRVAAMKAGRRSYGKIQALYDLGPPPPTHLLVRGNFETPGREVRPGFPSALRGSGSPDWIDATPAGTGTSGRRLALAKWLTRAGSPAAGLVARVMVNRIWQHLFRQGIVPTPDNFGEGGERPTHPELLEWLSAEFMKNGWQIKPLIRLIMISTVYRQASEPPEEHGVTSGDAENHLLGRMRLKRLESEIVRDAILSVSGKLDERAGGPPVMLEAKPDGTVEIAESKLPDATSKWRRSIYLLIRRAFNPNILTVFDQPVVATNCPERGRSAVPLQSLTMMNDAFLFEQSEAFAGRVLATAGRSAEERAVTAFRLALGRTPSSREIGWCGDFLSRQAALYRRSERHAGEPDRRALADLCHTLLSSSEFLYTP